MLYKYPKYNFLNLIFEQFDFNLAFNVKHISKKILKIYILEN